jgi:fatty-acyl-CoA synthase
MNPAHKGARHLLRLTALVGVLPLLLIAAGAVGTKLGLWGWRFGFGQLTVGWGSGLAALGLFTGLLALYVAAFGGFRRLWPLALVSLLVPVVVMAGFAGLRSTAKRFPGHDIATNWSPALAFSDRVMAARGPKANPVHLDPRSVWNNKAVENWTDRRAEVVNAEICPTARPARMGADRAQAYAKLKRVMAEQGLQILAEDPAAGRVEGVATTFWFEFKDDVVGQLRQEGGVWLADLRSVSRVGGSDLGANCGRVSELSEALGEG